MSAPQYVPDPAVAKDPSYSSPPRRSGGWAADRPGDLGGEGQPETEGLGNPGPNQGYIYKLLDQFEGKVHVTPGEHAADVEAGVVAIALKRASLFGRAPVVHDLTVGFALWGFLDQKPADALVARRKVAFASVSNPHDYGALRATVDAVPPGTLRKSHQTVLEEHRRNWAALLGS